MELDCAQNQLVGSRARFLLLLLLLTEQSQVGVFNGKDKASALSSEMDTSHGQFQDFVLATVTTEILEQTERNAEFS